MDGPALIGLFDEARRRRDLARAGRAVRAVRRAAARRCTRPKPNCAAHPTTSRRRRTARHRASSASASARSGRARRTPVMPKQRYEHHDALHAEGRHARPRHDVPHLHRAGEPRFRDRGRHGAQAARLARRCSRSRPRCSPIRRSPTASPTASCRCARRSGATRTRPRTGMLPVRLRAGHGLRALRRLGARRAACISSSAATITTTSPAPPSATCWQAACRNCPASARRCPTGPTTSRRCFRRFASSATSRCAAPTPARATTSPRCRPSGSACSTTRRARRGRAVGQGLERGGAAALRDEAPRLGLAAQIRGRDLQSVARDVLPLVKKGLARRARLDANGPGRNEISRAARSDCGDRRAAGAAVAAGRYAVRGAAACCRPSINASSEGPPTRSALVDAADRSGLHAKAGAPLSRTAAWAGPSSGKPGKVRAEAGVALHDAGFDPHVAANAQAIVDALGRHDALADGGAACRVTGG